MTALARRCTTAGRSSGQTLVNFDKYLKIMNPHTKQFVDDLKKLGQVALEYNDVAPDLLATLQNLQTAARTVVQKQAGLDNLLVDGVGHVEGAAGVPGRERAADHPGQRPDEQDLSAAQPVLAGVHLPVQGINQLYTLAGQAIYNNQIHLSATVDNQNLGPYKPGNQPKLVSGLGPNCFGLPNPPRPFQIPGKYRCINDGAALTRDACAQRAGSPPRLPRRRRSTTRR